MSERSGVRCEGADFCQELSGELDTEFRAVYMGDPPSRIIGRSQHLTLMADLSPLCAGHLLIVANHHHLSFAEMIEGHEREIKDFIGQTFPQYRDTFGEPLILEHGSAENTDGSACITHAHWHIVPLALRAAHTVMTGDGLTSIELERLGDLAMLGRGVPYFYCADRDSRRLYGVGQTMKRQYLRSVMGALLGIPDPEWDYAAVVRRDLLRITLARTVAWRIRVRLTSG